MEQFLACVREMLAKVVLDVDPACRQFRLQDATHELAASAAPRTRTGAATERSEFRDTLVDRSAQAPLADIVARAHLRGVWKILRSQSTTAAGLILDQQSEQLGKE